MKDGCLAVCSHPDIVSCRCDRIDTMPALFDAIGIVVADLPRSLAFYRLLGLSFPDGAESEGHVEAALPGGMRLMLDTEATVASFDPSFRPPTGPGRIGLAFACETPADVDRVHDAVVAGGFEGVRPPFDAFWGQRYATVADPDENAIDLFAVLES